MRKRTLVALGAVTIAIAFTAGAWTAAAAVLCQKKNGSIVVRDPSCRQKETPFDVGPFVAGSQAVTQVTGQVAELDGQVSSLQAAVTTLQAKNVLEAGKPGTIAASATVTDSGVLSDSFTQSGVVNAGRDSLGSYFVSFGFTLRQNQPILVTARFGYPDPTICWVGDIDTVNPFGAAYIYCRKAGAFADTWFTVVVLN